MAFERWFPMATGQSDQARRMIRAAVSKIRSETPPLIRDNDKVITTQIRSGFLNGSLVSRLIIHLHSSGCGWARLSGGCTMCGFYAATSTGTFISSEDYQAQVFDVLSKYDLETFSVIALFNAGNILNETEVPFDALEKICIRISQNPYIKKVTIESKLEYMNIEKLKRISALLSGKGIELGIGIETMNEKIRDLCINKPFPNTLLQQKVDQLFSLGITPMAYLLFKPPFLTEREAIDDFINSVSQLNQMGVHNINCETMTVEEYTLVHQLWKNNYYRLPWLWSMIYLMEQMKESQLYFTPFQYIVDAVAIAHNCDICSERIKDRIFEYQEGNLSLEDLTKENCSCKEEWRNEMGIKDERTIETRVINTLTSLAIA
jgi:archaeosine synthase beta-subunit